MIDDRGPIIGQWPPAVITPGEKLEVGDVIVIDKGRIRKARHYEKGLPLPEGSAMQPGGSIDVPEWWFWLHFRELLSAGSPQQCCGEGGVSRDYCADCPLDNQSAGDHTQGEFDL